MAGTNVTTTTTDVRIRELERAAQLGDPSAREHLDAELARIETLSQTVERRLLARVVEFPYSQTRVAQLARELYRDRLDTDRLPRGSGAVLEPIVARAYAASLAATAERNRLAAIATAAELRARASNLSLEDALLAAQRGSTQRRLGLSDVEEAVAAARATGVGHAVAEHAVARSYDYPVSYTRASAYRAEDGAIVVRIDRCASARPEVIVVLE